jgi:hypothetical protein
MVDRVVPSMRRVPDWLQSSRRLAPAGQDEPLSSTNSPQDSLRVLPEFDERDLLQRRAPLFKLNFNFNIARRAGKIYLL